MKEEYSKNPSPKLPKDIQEAKKHIPQLQGQLFKATGASQVEQIPPPFNAIVNIAHNICCQKHRSTSYIPAVSVWLCVGHLGIVPDKR